MIRPAVRALLLYLVAQTAAVAILFLAVAGFFSSWDGTVTGVLTPRSEEPEVYQAVILDEDGSLTQRAMPRHVVLGMNLPVLASGVPPAQLDPGLPESKKSRFTLHYLVQTRPTAEAELEWTSMPTTTPQALGLAVIVWLVALALRNMAYAGSPFSIERQQAFLPKAQTQAGSVAQTSSRPRKGPPPPRAQRGPRRR